MVGRSPVLTPCFGMCTDICARVTNDSAGVATDDNEAGVQEFDHEEVMSPIFRLKRVDGASNPKTGGACSRPFLNM